MNRRGGIPISPCSGERPRSLGFVIPALRRGYDGVEDRAACPSMRPLRKFPSPPLRGRCRRQRGGSLSQGLSGRWRRIPPLSFRDISPRKETFENLPLSPLAGEMPKAEEGPPHLVAYLVAGGGPPLCHSVTSPPQGGGGGGGGNHEFFKGLLAGEMPKAEGGAPHLVAYLVAGGGPPLCHSVTSPPARGGERTCDFCKGLRKGGEGISEFCKGLLEGGTREPLTG